MKKARRVEILNAAEALFRAKGVARTTMKDVAIEAACGRATLYRVFQSRDELIQAYFEREALRIGGELFRRVAALPTVESTLVECIAFSVESIRMERSIAPFFAPDAISSTLEAASDADFYARLGELLTQLMAGKTGRLRTKREGVDMVDWMARVVLSLATFEGARVRRKQELREYIADFAIPSLLEASD